MNPHSIFLHMAAVLMSLKALAFFAFGTLANSSYVVGRRIFDAQWMTSVALPSAASTTVTTPYLDLGALTDRANYPETVDVVIMVPALSTTMLPNGDTLTCTLYGGASSGAINTVIGQAEVVTGAGGVGAAYIEFHFKLAPRNFEFIAAQFTTGSGTTTMAALSGTLALGF